MPRKPPNPFFTKVEQHSNPDPQAAPLRALIGGTLGDFDEFATLEPKVSGRLIDDLEGAVRRAGVGYKFQRRGVSDRDMAAAVLMKDIAAALRTAGVPATRWRKLDDGSDRESLLFGVFRALAAADPVVLAERRILSDASLEARISARVTGTICRPLTGWER
jgi:hypothetical protein